MRLIGGKRLDMHENGAVDSVHARWFGYEDFVFPRITAWREEWRVVQSHPYDISCARSIEELICTWEESIWEEKESNCAQENQCARIEKESCCEVDWKKRRIGGMCVPDTKSMMEITMEKNKGGKVGRLCSKEKRGEGQSWVGSDTQLKLGI